jgi:hypothetical protein
VVTSAVPPWAVDPTPNTKRQLRKRSAVETEQRNNWTDSTGYRVRWGIFGGSMMARPFCERGKPGSILASDNSTFQS